MVGAVLPPPLKIPPLTAIPCAMPGFALADTAAFLGQRGAPLAVILEPEIVVVKAPADHQQTVRPGLFAIIGVAGTQPIAGDMKFGIQALAEFAPRICGPPPPRAALELQT